jgi:carbon monoxide dehydrogenase subunit G
VELERHQDGTLLRYTATADIGGKLAQLGSRLIQGTAKKLAAKFFKSFADLVGEDNVA